MRAPALRLRHAGREPFKGEDEELTFPARLPPRADSHRSQLWRCGAGICAVALEFALTPTAVALEFL